MVNKACARTGRAVLAGKPVPRKPIPGMREAGLSDELYLELLPHIMRGIERGLTEITAGLLPTLQRYSPEALEQLRR